MANQTSDRTRPRIAVLWRGDPRNPDQPTHYATRLIPVIQALQDEGLDVEPLAFFEEDLQTARQRLSACNGVLVWINPLADGRDRSAVDAMLRDLSAAGIWVSAHPHVIGRMGVKDVLFHTRALGWGSDTDLYPSLQAFRDRFPANLAKGPRVLKPHRGNDGQGVLKVEATGTDDLVRVQHASTDLIETIRMADLAARLSPAFDAGGRVIDQIFNPNAQAGMVRCYLSRDRVAGFAEQRPRIEYAQGSAPPFGMASAKAMHGPDAPAFGDLRRAMAQDWVPGMRAILGLSVEELPVIWDADFLISPAPDAAGNRYVLCEINVSCVSPFPDAAPALIAKAAKGSVMRLR